ncbi:hypothetical protein Cch01nite_19390 [Cellulomonas chitinilytica]|uniref:DUF998 domain-containing protein n=1 Tax=Cellulomonas chitinilytica TaxID=398759 RepID=A0A919TZ18_9CELL|nr:DUF998 domain-containing protein [Cellulomonas chitinilytica]GIG21215.1 hypothetical protein Cch01nite_19390 [Cellulomonas chitinilytica]
MTRTTSSPPAVPRSGHARQRAAAGALLVAGPAIFLVAEFVSAAAWTDPAYSYTYDFISNLGVQGPSTLFGQFMASPLYWLMNAGFFTFGLVVLTGVALLRGLAGRRRWAALVPAALLACGGVLLALFPGSGEALSDGTGEFHSMGAFAGFIGGNVLAIVLGRSRERLGLPIATGRALVTVGIVGLVSMVCYLALIVRSVDGATIGVMGLIERGATHPFLIATLCAGASIARRRVHRLSAPPDGARRVVVASPSS